MRTKWIYTILVLALGFFTSCNNEADETAGNKKTRTVVFRLAVDDAVGSRAQGDWSTNDNPVVGTGIENRIDLKGIRVAIYSINEDGTVGSRVGVADNLLYWSVNENSNTKDPIEYQLVGDISDVALEDNKSYRFMVYANFPNTTNNQFGLEDIDVNEGYIPMWGVVTHEVKGTELEELGTIDLLRAAAKVEVLLSETMINEGYTLENAKISNYSKTGNTLPIGWNKVSKTKDLDQEDCMNFVHDHAINLPMVKVNNSYVIYLPEYNNVHTSTNKATISLDIKNGNETQNYPDAIRFCDYSEDGLIQGNTDYNIVRNHIYQYTVTGFVAGGIKINYWVDDWHKGTQLDLGTLAYPTYHNPLMVLNGSEYVEPTDKPTMKYVAHELEEGNEKSLKEEGAFSAWFHLSAPSGQKWMPTIANQASIEYVIRVYKGNELVYSTWSNDNKPDSQNLVASDSWYNIKIIPMETINDAEVKKFKLGITSTLRWSSTGENVSTPFYLFINGKMDQIAWPDSGTDPKFIEIEQIQN